MKRVLFSLAVAAAISATAHAEVISYMANEGGGTIRLTDERRNCAQNNAYVFAVVAGGGAIGGCWTTYDRFVSVRWSDGEVRMYPLSDWTLTDYGMANGWSANANTNRPSTYYEKVRPARPTTNTNPQGVNL